MSSPLQPLTCNDTPQVAIRCFLGAFIGRLVGPHLDVFEPGVPGSSSWSSPIDSSFNRRCQNIIFSLYMAIVSGFSLFDLFKELSLSTESTQNLFICHSILPLNITDLPQAPHFSGFYLVLENLGEGPGFRAVGKNRKKCSYSKYSV